MDLRSKNNNTDHLKWVKDAQYLRSGEPNHGYVFYVPTRNHSPRRDAARRDVSALAILTRFRRFAVRPLPCKERRQALPCANARVAQRLWLRAGALPSHLACFSSQNARTHRLCHLCGLLYVLLPCGRATQAGTLYRN